MLAKGSAKAPLDSMNWTWSYCGQFEGMWSYTAPRATGDATALSTAPRASEAPTTWRSLLGAEAASAMPDIEAGRAEAG